MNEMRNGSLYYNKVTERVERVIGVVSKVRVLTYYHKQDEKSVQVKHLRLANKDEVTNYLNPPLETKYLSKLKERVKARLQKLADLVKV